MSDFDASSFLETVFTEPSLTEKLLCPVGDYPATIDKVEARKWAAKDSSSSGVALDLSWNIESDDARTACKRDKVIVRSTVMFSFTEDGMTIDMEKAKNDVNFGKLRDALGLNNGEFSPSMLPGKMARVQVKHRTSEKDGKQYVNEDISAVTRY
jgi:hypothetical protein